MNVFKTVPVDVIQIHEESAVDLFIRQEDRLVLFLPKGAVFTRDHLVDLNRFAISRVYIRSDEALNFEEYVHVHMDKIITDPTVPSRIKAATFYLSSIHALRKAFEDPDAEEIEEIKKTLGQTPPELAADIVERGIVMAGGGSLLKGLPKLVAKETGVPVILAERPLECVALGAGKYVDTMKSQDGSQSVYDSLNI